MADETLRLIVVSAVYYLSLLLRIERSSDLHVCDVQIQMLQELHLDRNTLSDRCSCSACASIHPYSIYRYHNPTALVIRAASTGADKPTRTHSPLLFAASRDPLGTTESSKVSRSLRMAPHLALLASTRRCLSARSEGDSVHSSNQKSNGFFTSRPLDSSSATPFTMGDRHGTARSFVTVRHAEGSVYASVILAANSTMRAERSISARRYWVRQLLASVGGGRLIYAS